MNLYQEPNWEPEDQELCPYNNGKHRWLWDNEVGDWQCSRCNVFNERQE